MILDARIDGGAWRYRVYNAKTCTVVTNAVWVDDESAQWGRYVQPFTDIGGRLAVESVQEERIAIYPDRLLVVFNEVEDHWGDECRMLRGGPVTMDELKQGLERAGVVLPRS